MNHGFGEEEFSLLFFFSFAIFSFGMNIEHSVYRDSPIVYDSLSPLLMHSETILYLFQINSAQAEVEMAKLNLNFANNKTEFGKI